MSAVCGASAVQPAAGQLSGFRGFQGNLILYILRIPFRTKPFAQGIDCLNIALVPLKRPFIQCAKDFHIRVNGGTGQRTPQQSLFSILARPAASVCPGMYRELSQTPDRVCGYSSLFANPPRGQIRPGFPMVCCVSFLFTVAELPAQTNRAKNFSIPP